MKSHLSRGLAVAALIAILAFLSVRPAAAATWVRIPGGGPPLKVVQMSFSKGRLLLKTEGNRMFTVPLDTPGLEIFLDGDGENDTLPATVVPGGILTLQDIVKMLSEGTSEETIAAFVEASEARYLLSKGSLDDLKRAGASDTFIQFLLRTGHSTGPGLNLGVQGQPQGQQQGVPQEPGQGADAGALAPYPVAPTDYNVPVGGVPLDGAYPGMGYGGGFGIPGYGYSYPITTPIDPGYYPYPGYYPCPVPCYDCDRPSHGHPVAPTAPAVTARPASAGVTVSGGTSVGAVSAATTRFGRATQGVPVTPQNGRVMRRNNLSLGLASRSPLASPQPSPLTMIPSRTTPQAAAAPRSPVGQVGQVGIGTMGMGAPRPPNSRLSRGGIVGTVPLPFVGRGVPAPGPGAVTARTRGAQPAVGGVPAPAAPAGATAAPAGSTRGSRRGQPRGRAVER